MTIFIIQLPLIAHIYTIHVFIYLVITITCVYAAIGIHRDGFDGELDLHPPRHSGQLWPLSPANQSHQLTEHPVSRRNNSIIKRL